MTLLITVAGKGFALAASDTRICTKSGSKFLPIDENFNKHIVFRSGGLVGDITYTGVAQWKTGGHTIRLYDLISDSISEASRETLDFGPLVKKLATDLSRRLKGKSLAGPNGKPFVEIHICGRHDNVPIPFIAVLSAFRTTPPWNFEQELQWDLDVGDFKFFLLMADRPEIVIGGMDTVVRLEERQWIANAITGGADAFNTSRMCSRIIQAASSRHQLVGARSVAVVLPEVGMLDTNLFDGLDDDLTAFLPRIAFASGSYLGPSEFKVDLNLVADGHLPQHSIFFKSVIERRWKKSIRRRMFRHRGGKKIPSVMGLLGLAIFGKIRDDYTDFGLGDEDAEEQQP
ncbi:hypothetical protein [Burkholderia gladioli]|uniref:hypothetical protein n=1 Tax=Burkholderia gladioli TaxID=28095 RepID=UPI0011D1B4F5|nr:hypothetical protein [Burkholderia gladioli]